MDEKIFNLLRTKAHRFCQSAGKADPPSLASIIKESKGDDAAAPRWTGEAAAESYMLNMEDVRGGV